MHDELSHYKRRPDAVFHMTLCGSSEGVLSLEPFVRKRTPSADSVDLAVHFYCSPGSANLVVVSFAALLGRQ